MQHLVEQGQEEREELFAAMDEVTLQCAKLEEGLDEARRLNRSKMLERDQAMAECKEVRYFFSLSFYIRMLFCCSVC